MMYLMQVAESSSSVNNSTSPLETQPQIESENRPAMTSRQTSQSGSDAKLITRETTDISRSSIERRASFLGNRACSEILRPSGPAGSRSDSQTIELDNLFSSNHSQQQRSNSISALSSGSEGPICRICHEGEETEDLLSPCHCTGTMGLLHLSCLEKWLGASSRTKCELCGFEYTVDSRPKPFIDWIRRPSSLSDRRNLICDLACFVLLTPLATISSWLCLVGAQYYSYWAGRWEVPGLISLTVFLLSIYLTWCMVVTRYHYRVWSDWKKHNQIVRIRAIKRGSVVSRDMNQEAGNNLLISQRNSQRQSSSLSIDINTNNNACCIEMTAERTEDVVVEVSRGPGQRDSYRLLSDSHVLVCSPNKTVSTRRHSSAVSSSRKLNNLSPGSCKSERSSACTRCSPGRFRFFSPRSYFTQSGARSLSCASESSPKSRLTSSSPRCRLLFTSPLSQAERNSISSAEDGNITVPLLSNHPSSVPGKARCSSSHSAARSVNRSLLSDPGFSPPSSSPSHSTMTSCNGTCDLEDVFPIDSNSFRDTSKPCRKVEIVRETYV